MASKTASRQKRPKVVSNAARASISFPGRTYFQLQKLAASRSVSVGWIVREAAEEYVAAQILASSRRK